ncbi:MAG: MATE family efflux transporter [Myxococcales bacterium]|nr:MATE family efflux transporter [Myxococcales bacterium]
MEPVSLREEGRTLVRLSLPVVAAQLGTMSMGIVDTAMLGRVDVDSLAAASLANAWVYFTLISCNGLLMGMDPIVSHAHGRGDGRTAAITLQRGLVLAALLSVAVTALWGLTGPVFALLRQEPHLVEAAHRYVVVQMPSVVCFLAFTAFRQQLQGRELMRPAMWATLVANLSNAFLNWVLIFGNLGFPALGLEGAGIATSLNRGVMLGLLLFFVWRADLLAGAWVPWSRDALQGAGLRHIVRLGLPVSIQMALEILAFSGSTVVAGWINPAAIAAHQVTLNFAAFSFMMPLGVSQAAATRVGNLLGARRHARAQRAAWLALALGACIMGVWALVFIVGRADLPRLMTSDLEVIAISASIFPIAAAFQVFDGTQVVGCGVLRGMGRTRPVAWFNLVAYWVLGLPIGGWLALRQGWGLAGIWWGLCLGLAVVAFSLVAWIRARGPESLADAPPLAHAP